MIEAFRRWFDKRARCAAAPLRMVAATPLFGGGAVHVADVDGRRIVFAATAHALCLLAEYPHGEETAPSISPGYREGRT